MLPKAWLGAAFLLLCSDSGAGQRREGHLELVMRLGKAVCFPRSRWSPRVLGSVDFEMNSENRRANFSVLRSWRDAYEQTVLSILSSLR